MYMYVVTTDYTNVQSVSFQTYIKFALICSGLFFALYFENNDMRNECNLDLHITISVFNIELVSNTFFTDYLLSPTAVYIVFIPL
jgi:hypothetical protein